MLFISFKMDRSCLTNTDSEYQCVTILAGNETVANETIHKIYRYIIPTSDQTEVKE